MTRWWTPSHRLELVDLITFIVGVGLLGLVGWKELYADVANFGAAGLWDYVKLFVWG